MNAQAQPEGGERAAATANERLKQSFSSVFWSGMIAATVLHFAIFALWPQLNAQDIHQTATSVETINLPPEVKIPPPPKAIARPATPVIASTKIDQDVTIAKTTFEQNKVENLPPPPKEQKTDLSQAPVFTPYTVRPEILNKEDVMRAMERDYPPLLRDAGIGGTVIVYFFIDAKGEVQKSQIFKTSGHPQLDSAAVKVASVYKFSPALNRDKKVPVWVQFPITFQVH
jgi:protein TonB